MKRQRSGHSLRNGQSFEDKGADVNVAYHKIRRIDTASHDSIEVANATLEVLPGPSLPELLDFTSLERDEDICSRFDGIAAALLHQYQLIVTSMETQTAFEILEVEFYLQKTDCHEDPFTHGSEEQKQSGNWYFHRAPRKSHNTEVTRTPAGGYRGGTRKGLDLTIGAPMTRRSRYFTDPSPSVSDSSRTSLLRGGALLRTLRRVSDSTIISGPSLLVDEVLRLSKAANIADLVAKKWAGDTSALTPPTAREARMTSLHLVQMQVRPPLEERANIYHSPRIGLDLSHTDIRLEASTTHPRVIYVAKPYRYFVHPHLLTANGRGQTFLGVYLACMDSESYEGDQELCDQLVKLTGLKMPTATKYLAEYKHGLESGSLKAFIGSAGKGVSASPTLFLRMMGTLHKLSRKSERHP